MVLAPALPELAAIALLLVALALTIMCITFMDALFGAAKHALGWVPWVGHAVTAPIERLGQRLNNYMSEVVAKEEASISRSWHALLGLVDWSVGGLEDVAKAVERAAWYVTSKYSLAGISAHVRDGVRHTPAQDARIKNTAREAHDANRAIAHPEAGPIAKGVRIGTRPIKAELRWFERWTIARVRPLSRAVAVDIPADIAGLRERTEALGRSIENAWRAIRSREKLILGAGAAALLATALRRIGGSWLMCRNANLLGRGACRMDTSLVDALLAGTLIVAGSISLVELARECETVLPYVANGTAGFVRETRDTWAAIG